MSEDKVLVERILHGNSRAFRNLVERYQRLVVSIVFKSVTNHEDREELCQHIFIKVYENLSDFKFKAKLSTWIAKIAYNSCLNYLRKEKLILYDDLETEADEQKNYKTEYARNIYAESKTPENLTEERDIAVLLRKSMEKLPQLYKIILSMFHLEDMNYKEIAEVTDLPEGTVKSYLFRARKSLKESIVTDFQGEKIWQ